MAYKNYYTNKKRNPSKPSRQRIGDYQIFIGAFLTGEFADRIEKVRAVIDAEASSIVAPHVTVVGTYWRNGRATQAGAQGLINRLEGMSSELSPFELDMGGIYNFGQRLIYLGVRPTEPLLSVRHQLLNVVGTDKHRRFRPHLTLAMELEQPAFDETLALLKESELANGRFTYPINTLCLMQRKKDEPAWRTIHELTLTN